MEMQNYVWIKHNNKVYLVPVGKHTGHGAYTEARKKLGVQEDEITMWNEADRTYGIYQLPEGFLK